jgi:hypothetical protein
VKRVLDGTSGVCFDLAASFYQVELPEKTRPFFSFLDEGGGVWQLTRLPMGLCVSPEIMNIITGALAGHPRYVFPWAQFSSSVGLSAPPCVHIDNIRAVGSQDTLFEFARRLGERARHVGATFNVERHNSPENEYVFCGILYNHEKKTVCVKPTKLEKIRIQAAKLEKLTNKEFEQLMGRLLFCGEVLALPMSSYYFQLKWWRRRLARLCRGIGSWEEVAAPPPSVLKGFKDWSMAVLKNCPRVPKKNLVDVSFVLFTDATLKGYGGVLVCVETGHVDGYGGKWKVPPHNIADAEMAAVQEAILRFEHILRGRGVLICVDNTSVLHVLEKRRSTVTSLTVIVKAIERTMRENQISFEVRWVPSGLNPADGPSRSQPINFLKAKERANQLRGELA